MKQPKLTPLQIVDETVKYYAKDRTRRAIEHKMCQYNSKDGQHCAVGRCLLPKYQKLGTELKGNSQDVNTFALAHGVRFDKMLQMKYRGQPKAFWEVLQNFHDTDQYFYKNKNGLTKKGLAEIKELKKLIKRELL
jgi:hypothetical protein